MKAILRGLGIGAAALAVTLISSGTAQAGTVFKDAGAKHSLKGCTNYVFMWNAGDKMYAYGQMNCDRSVVIARPTIALSGNNGVTFKTSGKACTRAVTCRTPTVTVKATKGWTYRASNSGTASTGVPTESDILWPLSSIAYVQVTL
ncbi:hypothetical protein J7E99_35310 [Streptomyces sp. ISL-44]|uniref:hypothetical protein n=1 Tax=Streptomyces sp. ISL-44 TaxID=2819184 RepID=UPI001BE8AB7B|nr:hypothetical protein [Streptomyces sp. ISL-44]MBT2545802.1 hypothetical protein [Streptomyces sp. ISL-44]